MKTYSPEKAKHGSGEVWDQNTTFAVCHSFVLIAQGPWKGAWGGMAHLGLHEGRWGLLGLCEEGLQLLVASG